MAQLRLDLPPGLLIVDPAKVTPDQMDMLSDFLVEVSRKHSIFGKFPLNDGESLDEWKVRVETELPEANRKKEEETNEQYFKRVFKPLQDKKQMVFDTLEAFGKVFGGTVSYDGFRKAPYGDSKNFVIKVLKGIDFPVGEYE